MKLFDVISTSFENFDATIDRYLSKTLGAIGVNYSGSQIYAVIFRGIKGVMQNAMFYIEDALTEQNIYTAARKKSIYSLAKSSGYEAYYGSSAVGIINGNVAINNGLSNSISTKISIFDNATVINKNSGITYFISLNTNKYTIDIKSPLKTHEFKIVQGFPVKAKYVAKGEPLEKISIDIRGLFDRDYIKVFVNGEEWSNAGNLYDMTYKGKEYMMTVGYENSFDIIFGNGTYGMIPESGSSIEIHYVTHSGSMGNIDNIHDSDFKFVSPGYDSYGNTVDLNQYIKLSLSTVISGGTDADSIEFVRNMIGYNSRSNVLVSEENFRLFFKRFSFVGQVNCWTERNNMTIWVTCITNVVENLKEINEYYALKNEDFLLSQKQKNMIMNTLENSKKSFAGLTIKFQDPVIRRFAIFCYLKIKTSYVKETVENSVREIFAKYFMSLDESTKFIPKSDLINLGSTCNENIEAFDIDIISEAAEEAAINGYYYKYELVNENNTFSYKAKKTFYEDSVMPCLDIAGNISLDTNLEIPVLGANFKYSSDKSNINANQFNLKEPITFFYI